MEENINDRKDYREGVSLVCTHLFSTTPDNKPTIVGVLHSWRKKGGESSLFLVSRNSPWYFPKFELIHACNQDIKIKLLASCERWCSRVARVCLLS